MKINLLAFGAHPDDVELGAGGTMLAHKAMGYSTGIIDLTSGQMGTRGTAEIRAQEAANATAILGLDVRENLQMADGLFENNIANQLLVVQMLRKYQPDVVLINAPDDRHPDHPRGAALLKEAIFKAGLRMLTTEYNGLPQAPWRPRAAYHYIQFLPQKPDLIVDISAHIEQKMAAIHAYKTQFFDPQSKEPATLIAGQHFLDIIRNRALDFGHQIGKTYGEGFVALRTPGVADLLQVF
jgi:N-acetylglucosamine malate deacetylase 1